MGFTVPLVVLLFKEIWGCEAWQNRCLIAGEPWVVRQTTEEPPVIFWDEETADAVRAFVDYVRGAGNGQKGKKTAYEAAFQGPRGGDDYKVGRAAWKVFVNARMGDWGLRSTAEVLMANTGFTVFTRLTDDREVSAEPVD